MKLHIVAAAAALAAAASGPTALAAIAPGTSGNGELFLVVQNDTNKVSFTYDLGIQMDAFIAGGEAPGYSQSFAVGADPNWGAFVQAASSLESSRWAVVAIDSTGNNQPNSQRLLTTVFNDPSKTRDQIETQVRQTSNQQLSLGIGATQAGNFFNSVNTTGTHLPFSDFAVNGSSVNLQSNDGQAYFGAVGGLTPTFNGNAQFQNTNAIGASSLFYFATRSSTSQLTSEKILLDRFSSAAGDGSWTFTGQQLTFLSPVPEPGTYALMALGLLAIGGFANRRR